MGIVAHQTAASPRHSRQTSCSGPYYIVRSFQFVGLTEEWNRSVCLWHATFGGAEHPSELLNVRPGNRNGRDGTSGRLPSTEQAQRAHEYFQNWRDPYDDVLYQEVVALFRSRVHRSVCEGGPVVHEGLPRVIFVVTFMFVFLFICTTLRVVGSMQTCTKA